MQVYEELIADALARRGSSTEDWSPHPQHPHHAQYEVRLCEGLLVTFHTRGFEEATLKDVFRLDGCAAGHVDYQRKLGLYCAMFEEELLQASNRRGSTEPGAPV